MFIVNGAGNNLFHPAFGKVPGGFGNSSSADGGSGEPFALVSDSVTEFGYEGGAVQFLLTVDFTSAGLITITGNGPAPPSFTSIGVSVLSPAFPGLSITPVSSTPFGGCSLVTNTFACNFGTVTAPFTLTRRLRHSDSRSRRRHRAALLCTVRARLTRAHADTPNSFSTTPTS